MPRYTTQTSIFSEKVFDLDNIAAGAILFSQPFNESQLNYKRVMIGLAILCFCYGSSIILLSHQENKYEST